MTDTDRKDVMPLVRVESLKANAVEWLDKVPPRLAEISKDEVSLPNAPSLSTFLTKIYDSLVQTVERIDTAENIQNHNEATKALSLSMKFAANVEVVQKQIIPMLKEVKDDKETYERLYSNFMKSIEITYVHS